MLPNVDGILCAYLDQTVPLPNGWSRTADVADLPAGRAVQYGGGPVGRPAWVYRSRFQVDVWAESAAAADNVQAALLHAIDDMPGVRDGGVVSDATVDNASYVPDGDWPEAPDGGAMPRWRTDVTVTAHPTFDRR